MGWWRDRWKRRQEMGRLSPGQSPHGPMGTMAPARKKAQEPAKVVRVRRPHPCDRCGTSHIDKHQHISTAKFEVKIPEDGSIFLCGHHFREHRHYIHEHAYEVVDHAG